MKKSYIISGVVVVVLIVVIILISGKAPSSNGPIKLGVLYPLTGDAVSIGDPIKKGVELAVKEINDQGGINGRLLEPIYEDSKCEPKTGVSGATKLINIDKVSFIIGDICSAVVIPIAPIAEQNKVVVMAQGSSPDITTIGDYIFRNWPSDSYQGELISGFAINKLNLKKFAILSEDQAYSSGLAKAFKEGVLGSGGEIIAEESFKTSDKDYRTQLTKIKNTKPDAIYLSSSVYFGLIAKQMKDLGINAQIIGGDGLGTDQSLKDAAGSLEGAYYAFPYFDENSKETQDFQNKFSTMFGEKSAIVNVSAHGYDAVYLLSLALKSCSEDFTSTCVKNEIYKIKDFPGVSGKTTFDQNGDVEKPYAIYKITDGKPVEVK
jgi:branched-chain amino acid transport system substrate-binding protein